MASFCASSRSFAAMSSTKPRTFPKRSDPAMDVGLGLEGVENVLEDAPVNVAVRRRLEDAFMAFDSHSSFSFTMHERTAYSSALVEALSSLAFSSSPARDVTSDALALSSV